MPFNFRNVCESRAVLSREFLTSGVEMASMTDDSKLLTRNSEKHLDTM